MASVLHVSNPRRLVAPAVVLLLLAPALAGCVMRNEPNSVKTSCEGAEGRLDPVPTPRAFEHRAPGTAVTPPFQGTVRVTLLLPANAEPGIVNGARLAASELGAAGAPLELREVVVNGTGPPAGRAAFEAAIGTRAPSAIVSALDNATTEGMVPVAVERRVPLIATQATASSLTAAQDTAGMVFRVPPPDSLAGRAAADLVWAAGCRSASVVTTPGAAASDLVAGFRVAFEAKGGAIGKVVMLANRNAVESAVTTVEHLRAETGKDAPRPAAILVVAGPEDAGAVLKNAYGRGISGKSVFFFTESAKSPALATAAGRDATKALIAANLRGTSPMATETAAFAPFAREYANANGVEPTNASRRAYDAVYATTLAATCARSPEPARVAEKLPVVVNDDAGDTDVSGADVHTAVTVSAQCSVNYVGVTHDDDWTRRGDPESGRFYVWTLTVEGAVRVAQSRLEPETRAGAIGEA